VFWALTLILLAVAGFSVVVVRRPRRAGYDHDPRFDVEQFRGFVYVGAAVLVLVAVGVVLLGLFDPGQGKAEALAVLGFLGYGLYLTASAAALGLMNRTASVPRPSLLNGRAQRRPR
jgi:drug/metabolite transporter (DMT)-like permease